MDQAGTPAPWPERMEQLRDGARERLLEAPMSSTAMTALLESGSAQRLGEFEGSPVRYADRWWRQADGSWQALDGTASAGLDQHAERYRAAAQAARQAAEGQATATVDPAMPMAGRPEAPA